MLITATLNVSIASLQGRDLYCVNLTVVGCIKGRDDGGQEETSDRSQDLMTLLFGNCHCLCFSQ